MKIKNKKFKKQLNRKKMTLTVIYGIIFLISTMAFYFVNTSKAQEIQNIKIGVIDQNLELDEIYYQEKVAKKENGIYKITLPSSQNEFIVDSYFLITEDNLNKILETKKQENNSSNIDIQITEKENDEDETIEENEDLDNENSIKENVQKNDNKGIESNVAEDSKTKQTSKEIIEKIKENAIILRPETEYEVTTYVQNEKPFYLMAKYEKEENKNLYNKKLLYTTDKNTISVTGYMPQKAEIKVKEVDKTEVENKINTQQEKDVKLQVAYDIKILIDGKEFEPEDLEEEVTVEIKGINGEIVRIWHLKGEEKAEEITSKVKNNEIMFKTASFSIYGVEVVEDITSSEDNTEESKEKSIEENIDENIEKNTEQQDNNIDQSLDKPTIKSGPLRAPASTAGDSTLEIDDYYSDYYYYKGKNYTDDISGVNQGTYKDTDLVKVTLIYHGFAQGENDNEKKGRISLTETQDIVQNIRCAPVSGGYVTLELMENPFMDKPTGYGFGGWTTSLGTVTQDTKTLTYSLRAPASGDITVNLYANWTQARVVYVNPSTGCDNLISSGYDGSTPEKPLGSWQAACNRLYSLAGNSTNREDRENNIIVVTGNMDSSINYTRPITGTLNHTLVSADAIYTNNNGISNNTSLIISDNATAIGSNALSGNNSELGNIQITSSLPSQGGRWIITGYNGSYSIRNEDGYYLTASNSSTSTLSLSNSSFSSWSYENNRFYYARTTGNWWNQTTYYYYLSLDGNNWKLSEGKTRTGNYGTAVYFHRYTTTNEVYENSLTTSQGSLTNNTYYGTGNNRYSLALTVTSLYNHEDYRNNATISLTSSSYFNWTCYKAFQMNHVKISASGYTSNNNGDNFNSSYPKFTGRNNNVRIGRGMTCANTATTGCIFANIIGGTISSNTSSDAYKIIVESGKYSSAFGFTGSDSGNNYSGTVYFTLGNDIDRKNNTNNELLVYYAATINSGSGKNGTSGNDKAFLINVKSGSIGTPYFDSEGKDNNDSAYSGIYVGGWGTSNNNNRDVSDRYCIIEGGKLSNIVGGLKTTSGTSVKTRVYVKGGEIYNIVGGAGVTETYGDRIIQVTGGTIDYSISAGSNGVYASTSSNNGKLSGQTLVYAGGTATIGTSTSITDTLYGVSGGCILGAGNGNQAYMNSGGGQVNNSHVIVNDSAHILNSIYGGGNYGIVGASNSTSATSKVDILGGTIDKNVYGGANQNNIYGSTTINIKGGQVKGAVYGGSNTSGTISTNTTIEVSGGTLGQSTTTSNAVLFGGGYGSSTTVSQNTTVKILDTDGNVKIYGNAYGGSAQGTITGNTVVEIQDLPSTTNTISITGNVYAGGQGTSSQSATINGNSTISVDGSNLPDASIFGGNDINGVTNGNIIVNIGQTYTTKIGKTTDTGACGVYGGGNQDATGTEADSVKVYLLSHADVEYAFNGGKSANFTTSGVSDQNRGIYLQGGYAKNIFGGSDTSGDVNASHVYIQSGTADNVYGGNNKGGTTTTSTVNVTGGTVTNVYGGGYQASTTTSNVNLTGATITNGFGGGNAASVTTSNIILNGSGARAANIYGGSNSAGTVTASNVTITSGTVTNVYGGNNAGGDTVNTLVTVNSPATNVFGGGNQAQTSGNTTVYLTSTVDNIYGGGTEAITSGNTYVKLTNATVNTNAYGGGNGSAAVVAGNSTIIVEGSTSIGKDLFGGGNAAANGSENNDNSEVTVLITGGTISGDVYGAANTSVVYGNTHVKIGSTAVNDNTLTKGRIQINGTVLGGGKSNNAGSANYDFSFESVTKDVFIDINASGYDNGTDTFNISGSVFGSGNAAKISGDGYVNITNYGTASNIKENISIQRATKVIIDNSHIYLSGTTDRTNEIATAIYTFNRINDLVIKNNTRLYLQSGVNITSKLESLTANDTKAQVTITEANGITSSNVDNRIYLSQGRNIILKTEEGTNGEVHGMTYVGLFAEEDYSHLGIYNLENYEDGDTVVTADSDMFTRNSYVQGKHYYGNGVSIHNIEADGFYTNYDNQGTINTAYINPTPESADYYQWICGKISSDIYYEDIELIATKYATTASYVLSLDGLSEPNTTVKVKDIDTSALKAGITLNNPENIPNIASSATDADTKFGITMTAGNTGWQTKGTTNYLRDSSGNSSFVGTTEYLGDNSTTTPTFSFYMDHSKNISSTEVLGKVTIHIEATYVDSNEEIQIKNAYIVIKLSINNTITGQDYYEGAITPGKQYSIFPTTTTTITKNSSFSAYYSLYIGNYSTTKYYKNDETGLYEGGYYYHALYSTCVLPAKTKITLIDTTSAQHEYFYYIVTSEDEASNKNVYRFNDFKHMDSTNRPYSKDVEYYNASLDLMYEEFIVQVDFEDTQISSNLESEHLYIQLRDNWDDSVPFTVNSDTYPMIFSVYNDIEADASINMTLNKNVLYMGDALNIALETEYKYNKNENQDVVYDTTHIDDMLGVRFTISAGSQMLTSQDLEGIYISYRGSNYFAKADGTYRMKIADAVSNVLTEMTLYTTNGHLETGTYTITAESFGSIDRSILFYCYCRK